MKLIQVRGRVNFYNLENRLNDAQVQQLAPILLPVFKAWGNLEKENGVLSKLLMLLVDD